MIKKNFNQYLQWSDILTILLTYLSENPSDKNFIKTLIRTTELSDSINNLDLLIDKKYLELYLR